MGELSEHDDQMMDELHLLTLSKPWLEFIYPPCGQRLRSDHIPRRLSPTSDCTPQNLMALGHLV